MRAALLLLLACALFARLAAPSGWMPAADGAGLMLCPEAGPVVQAGTMHHTGHGKPAKPDHQGGERQPCAFAGLSLAADAPPVATVLLTPFFQPEAPPQRPIAVAVGRGLAAPPPPATGPPLLA